MDFSYTEKRFKYDGREYGYSGFNPKWLHEINNVCNIIEFGSYDGGDAIQYKINFPQSNVYSIEADPIQYNNIKYIEQYGVRLFNYAVCDLNGQIEFNRCLYTQDVHNYKAGDIGGSGSLLSPSKYNKDVILHQTYCDEKVVVPAITLDMFCSMNDIASVDLLHIDVEGATLKVLKGMSNIRPKIIFVEIDGAVPFYNDCPTFDDIHNQLINMGYDLIFRNKVDSLYELQK